MKIARRHFRLLLCVLLFGAILGSAFAQQDQPPFREDDLQASFGDFSRVYELVEQNYADFVDPDLAIYGTSHSGLGAIPGMLRTLDPHSNFFDPRAYTQMREQQEGKYPGVGMRIGPLLDKTGKMVTIVVQPMPGSPAFRAGLRPGDIILRVDDKPADGLSTTQVASMLKGPRGTSVHIAVSREGSDEPLEFDLIRDEISSHSVDDAFFIRPHVAYIHISGFTETTDDELSAELKTIDPNSLQGLILDLRGNPGGLLQEAVNVADHFLEKNQLIVYHHGRRSREKRYYAIKGDGGSQYPIVVLINRMTASSAEIVTGALQDHDRALVIGEPSFGKGLVQTVYPLSEHTGLALTTARYFTPSGRLIQRNYANVSLYDYYYHYQTGPPPRTDVRLTDGGRDVYGGGGILPDIQAPLIEPNEVQRELERRGTFFDFGKHYLGVHKTIARDFAANDQVLAEFAEFLKSEKLPFSDADLLANRDYISNHIRVQLVSVIFGSIEADKMAVDFDPLVQKAIDNLGQARELTARAKRYIATKSPD